MDREGEGAEVIKQLEVIAREFDEWAVEADRGGSLVEYWDRRQWVALAQAFRLCASRLRRKEVDSGDETLVDG